jgi:hypothetical protein
VKDYLSSYSDDATKAIESIVEENKTLKTKVSVLQNVTVSASKPLQNATSGFTTGVSYSNTTCSMPTMNVDIPNQSVFIDSDWKKLKSVVESALEPYVGR